MAAGLDSLGAVELRNTLEARLGVGAAGGGAGLSLPLTLVFDYPSAAAIAGLVAQRLAAAGSSSAPEAFASPAADAAAHPPQEEQPPGPSLPELQAQVAEEVEALLGRAVAPDAPLMAAGLDSLSSLELRGALQARFGGGPLPATLAMDYPSVAAIAALLHGRAAPGRAAHGAPAAAAQSRPVAGARAPQLPAAQAIAVVGMAARVPGAGLDGRLELAGSAGGGWADAVTPVPQARWLPDGAAAALHDGAPARFGAFLPGIEAFDAAAFGIAAPEAALMDPQQRLLLEALYEAAAGGGAAGSQSGSGAAAAPLLGSAAGAPGWGVYVGISAVDFSKLGKALGLPLTPYTATGSLSLSVAAGRLSYAFGLTGPSLAVDTACSSSLVAAHSAREALCGGACGGAVAAGVNVALIPDTPAMFQHAGGCGRSRGAGLVVLKA
jgi:acyl carrier protein